MVTTLSPKQFLRKNLIEGIANKQMEQNLDFMNLFDITYTDNVSVTYHEDLTTAGEDITNGVMGEPLDLGELSELTTVEISPITQKSGMLNPFGLQIKVSERDMRRSEIINDLVRATDRAAFAMAKKVNDDIVTDLAAVTNDITEVDGSAVWSGDTADPVGDIVLFQEAMDLEGWGQELTDLFLHKTNYYEFKKYMLGVDRDWAMSPLGGNKEVPNVMGVNIHNTKSTQLSEGAYLGIDSRPGFRPMEIYAYRPEGFGARPELSLINVYRYKEEKYPHNEVVEFVAETMYALKQPNSVCYKSSGI